MNAKEKKELETYWHTNKVQAEHISKLQSKIHTMEINEKRLEKELEYVRQRYASLMKDHTALKDLLGLLSRGD